MATLTGSVEPLDDVLGRFAGARSAKVREVGLEVELARGVREERAVGGGEREGEPGATSAESTRRASMFSARRMG